MSPVECVGLVKRGEEGPQEGDTGRVLLLQPRLRPRLQEPGRRAETLVLGSPRGVALVLGLLFVCPCLGVLTAVSIPNYNRFPVRAKQAECKTNLRALFTAQRNLHAEHGSFDARIMTLGFNLERGNRYAYFTGEGPLVTRDAVEEMVEVPEDAGGIGVDRSRDMSRRAITLKDLPAWVSKQVGVFGTCPDCDVTMACAGDIDIDDTLDVWLISTGTLKGEDGEAVPPGTPTNAVNDVDD